MIRRPPRSTRTDTLFPYTTLFRSRHEQFVEALTSATGFLYSCPNLRTRYRLKPLDAGTPTYMRGPGEASGIYAIECAMDELAHALGIDPHELPRRNEPELAGLGRASWRERGWKYE